MPWKILDIIKKEKRKKPLCQNCEKTKITNDNTLKINLTFMNDDDLKTTIGLNNDKKVIKTTECEKYYYLIK